MGQTAHLGRRTIRPDGVVVALCLIVGSPLLTGCGTPLTAATTTLAGVVDTEVVHPNGAVVSGVDGLHLRPGDLVRTGPAGRAELHTRGRVVYAGSGASLQVLNGAHDLLRRGALVVDAQRGPRLLVDVGGLLASVPGGSASRIERSVTVRVAALEGATALDSDTGRHLDVAALDQVVVGGDALPDSSANTPLRLTDDDGEAHAVPVLVRDDLALDSLAAGIDATAGSTAQVVTAAWHHPTEPLPAGLQSSEQVLPIVIAAAGTGGDALGRYQFAVALRKAGGSWAVVAHRVGANEAAVGRALDLFERASASGQAGTVAAALGFITRELRSTGTQPVAEPSSPAGGGPKPGPRPSPSESPGLIPATVAKVLSLVPSPLPKPTALASALPGTLVPNQLAPSGRTTTGPAGPAPVPTPSIPIVSGLLSHK
jgi:hypothetical protein